MERRRIGVFLAVATALFAPSVDAFAPRLAPPIARTTTTTLLQASSKGSSVVQSLKETFSQRAAMKAVSPYPQPGRTPQERFRLQLATILRISIPSVLIGVGATLAFPGLALFLASTWNDAGVFAVLSQDSSQFVQNFLTVAGLLFSILVGQTYYFVSALIHHHCCCIPTIHSK